MSPRHARLILLALLTSLPGKTLLGEPPESGASVRTDHYGDPLPKDARFRLGTVRLRHTYSVTAIAWQSDGRTLASAGEDGTVRLWQIPNGKQIAKWENARSVVFSPDGRTLAYTGTLDDAVHCIDVAGGKELRKIPLPSGDCSVAFSQDGKTIAAAKWGWEGIDLYSVDTGKKLRALEGKLTSIRPHPDPIFSRDGRDLIGATVDGICCWNTRTGAKQFPLGKTCFDAFAFSPNGKMVAAIENGSPGAITLRSWPAGEELCRVESQIGGFEALAFSPDGKILATNEWGNVRLWNPATGRLLHCCKVRWGSWSLAFSPDGSLLASAGQDGAVNVWDVRSGEEPRRLPVARHRLAFLGLAKDSQTLLTRSTDDVLTVWDARDGHRLRALKNEKESADDFLFGPNTGRLRALLRHQPALAGEQITVSAFSADNTSLAVGSNLHDRVLLVHKTAHDIEVHQMEDDAPVQQARRSRESADVRGLTFSPDGRILAAAYSDHRLILWDWRRKLPIRRCSLADSRLLPRHLAFSPDGRLLAVSDGTYIDLVEAATGKVYRQLHHDSLSITSLIFSPDNRTLAVGVTSRNQAPGVKESVVHLWDLLSEKPIHILHGHKNEIHSLTFSLDGASIFSDSDDQTVLCWDVAVILRRRMSSKELSASQWTALWTDLASKDAMRGQQAVVELSQAPDAALAFLERFLPPAAPMEVAHINALVADLDHEQFARRQRASEQLSKLGEQAMPALRKAVQEKPSLEKRKRIELLLETMDEHEISPIWLRAFRAVQVLETIGTPEARRVLEGLAHGAAEACLTCEARAAVQRLDRRNTKP